MQAIDVLNYARELLRDEDMDNYAYTNGSLLEKLSLIQNDLISDFRDNIDTFIVKDVPQAMKQKGYITMPCELAHIFIARLDNKPLEIRGIYLALREPIKCLYHLSGARFGIRNYAQESELEITASCLSERIRYIETKLALDSSYLRALALGVVCAIIINESNALALQKIPVFKDLYEQEKAKIRAKKNILNTPRNIHTKVFF